MKTNILLNMNSFAIRAMMVIAVVMMTSSAWGSAGDEITSHTNIVSGTWYYIKGVRTNGTTIEYLTFGDNLGTVSGTSASTTNGAIPLKFTYESSKWYITTPKGYYVTTTTSNGKLTLTSTPTAVTLGTSSSKITIQGDSYYLQKNGTASNFGSYNNSQQNVTLIEAQTYTVNWSVNGGSCSGSPSTEGQSGHKIAVLPTTPTSCDASKVFVGWSASSISGSTNIRPSDLFTYPNGAPTITGNVTYYAVFAVKSNESTLLSEDFSSIVSGNSTSTSGSSSAWSSLTDNFTSSAYAYQAGGAVRLGTGTTGYLVTKELTAAVGSVLTVSFGVKGWTTVEGDVAVTANNSEFSDPASISYSEPMSGSFETQAVSVVLTTANPKIKISALSCHAFIDDLVITKATYSEYVTTCCDKLVELSKGTQTNATISSFSPSSVPTCSETASNRNVTITVAAAAGYEFTSSARLTYSGDGTATYQSGPTGSGPYTFVYQFAKNDNGEGTFSVTSATPQTYTITYKDQGGGDFTGTQAGAPTTHTYGTATTLKIPTKYGHTFGGWFTASDCASGAVGTSSSATLGATDYTANITLYAKWTEKSLTNYRTSCCTDPELSFLDENEDPTTTYTIVREDLASASTAVEIDCDFGSLNTSSEFTWYSTSRAAKTFPETGATSRTTPSSQLSYMTIDMSNKTITASQTGIYIITIKQAGATISETVYCDAEAEVVVTVKTVDKFIDAVNGNFSGEAQRLEDVGGGILLPTEATFSINDACHLTTRRLLGWIKASDLNSYRTSGNTGYIDTWKTGDPATNKVIAPGTRVEATGVTWYAVWGEEVTP